MGFHIGFVYVDLQIVFSHTEYFVCVPIKNALYTYILVWGVSQQRQKCNIFDPRHYALFIEKIRHHKA